MKTFSLKTRIFLSFAAIIVVFALGSVLLVELYIKKLLHDESVEDGKMLSSLIAGEVSRLTETFNYPEIDTVFQSYVHSDSEIDYIFVEKDGAALILASRNDFPVQALSLKHPAGRQSVIDLKTPDHYYYDVSTPLVNGLSLRIGIDERLGPETTWRLVAALLLIALLLGGLSMALAVLLAKRLTDPLRSLKDSAAQIAGGAYDIVAPADRNDEVGDLARSFNEMTQAIRKREKELQSANIELESVNVSLKQYVDELNRTRDELLKAHQDTAVIDTARAFMHHLRQPLTYLLMSTEMLLDEVAGAGEFNSESAVRKLKTIEEAGRQVSKLLIKLERIRAYRTMEYDEYSKILDIDTDTQ